MDEAQSQLEQLRPIIGITGTGDVTLLRSVGSTEDLIVSCLVAQNLAHKLGKTKKETMSVDDFIGAGGLAQRVARQTVYNTTSALSKNRIIQKRGNEFYVSDRTILQFFSAKLPQLIKSK